MCNQARIFLFVSLLLPSVSALGQDATIKGMITGVDKKPIPGVSIAVSKSYDGSTTDSLGHYVLSTALADTITLNFSFIGFKPKTVVLLNRESNFSIDVQLEELVNELNVVTVSAGSFDASNDKKNVMLKPLDIASTAAGGADITGVVQLLPGAQKVGESEGLFVRGGSAQETKVLIDGMYVQNPFYSPNPGIAQRGRFSPFMFKSTSFSTGGFSTQYGQALSSVLSLFTNDKLNESGWNVSLNAMSAGLTGSKATDKYSFAVNGYYGNTGLLNNLIHQNVEWVKSPDYQGGSFTGVWTPSDFTTIKAYATASHNKFRIFLSDYNQPTAGSKINYGVGNDNYYANSSIKTSFGTDYSWQLDGAVSYNRNNDAYDIDGAKAGKTEQQFQMRYVLRKTINDSFNFLFGNDVNVLRNTDNFAGAYNYQLNERNASLFTESEWHISPLFGVKIGGRLDYSGTLNKAVVSPRATIAYKTGQFSQLSFASGLFTQTPYYKYLYVTNKLDFEKAFHYIASYQVIKEKRTFKAEAFYKKYSDLVLERTTGSFDADPLRFPTGALSNGGYGYAQGLDLFWRDRKTLRNTDYWITYTFVDSRRIFQNYPVETVPTFASRHNLNVIYKYTFPEINFNVGFTYLYTGSRPYYNPADEQFLQSVAPPIHNVGLSASYLTNIAKNFTILYASVDNVLNSRFVYTYRYYQDQSSRDAIRPQTQRGFFVGMIIYFSSKFKIPDEFKLVK
ncbi:TonB-dependent receptor [Spirosoma fluviale]|uniref:Outer membrane receptor for ferrienterochelin and colicins n=1 Tax=Spirosoma fluviale TaxID=1597977 RepID=A0A286GUA1_9BACT|nr:TonB-dependent receptor [Spirosoma fluviale]SOD99143.1 Outer membrane receptor for ferrienterochelin and colicins [Spirosoma fluviale]